MSTIVCDEPNGWTPIHNGDVYCSRLCGCQCTWEAYRACVDAANALCGLLGAHGEWKPIVSENTGWHYEAVRGNATVNYYPKPKRSSRQPKFSCWIRITPRGAGGHMMSYIAEHPEDPRAAVHGALALWRADLDTAEREYLAIKAGTAPTGAILATGTDDGEGA